MGDYFLPHDKALQNRPERFFEKINPKSTCKLGKYRGFRHTCIEDGEETKVTFCNNCHSAFSYKSNDGKCTACADCGLIDCDLKDFNKYYLWSENEKYN